MLRARLRRVCGALVGRAFDGGLTKELLSALTTAVWERRCDSERDGKDEAVRLLPTPMTLLADAAGRVGRAATGAVAAHRVPGAGRRRMAFVAELQNG